MLDVDLGELDGRREIWGDRPMLVVARDDGIPVGSALLDGDHDVTAAAVTRRSGPGLAGPAVPPVSVTVAICTRDRPTLLARCLDAVAAAIVVAGDEVTADVLVVDNASRDGRTREVAEGRGATVHVEPVAGLDVARNRAVAASGAPVIAFVDDDAVVDPTWLRTLARTFAAHPDAAAVTGGVLALRLDTAAQLEFERAGGFFKGWRAGPLDTSIRPDLPFDPSIGVGCNMAFRRTALEAVGPFDEALDTGSPLAGGGDLDMLVRVAMTGTVVYEPSAMVRHEHRHHLGDLRRQYRSWGLSWGAVLHKWYREAPAHRKQIRRAAGRALRWYGHDLVTGRRCGLVRRRHALALLLGFTAGATVAYPRSQRRMERRSVATRRRART
jgi:GT2 family glycosyltransferase